jgi:hypothetical protein
MIGGLIRYLQTRSMKSTRSRARQHVTRNP